MKLTHSAVLFILTAAVIICLGLVIYFATLPSPRENFSEFYILNENGKPYDYPIQTTAGKPFAITIGIVNHEAGTTLYSIRIMSGGVIIKSLETAKVPQGQKWEEKTDIIAGTPGQNRQIEFYLFLKGEEQPHIKQPLVLILNVKEQ